MKLFGPPTPHNEAKAGDFAKTVLLPGDPARSRWIAQEFLTDARLVNDVRGAQGYTGLYKGRPVSVMASFMGMPSMAIYAAELYGIYDVEALIRIGTAGALREDVQLGDVVAAMSCFYDSAFGAQFGVRGHIAPTCDYSLLRHAEVNASQLGVPLKIGPVRCSDVLYDLGPSDEDAQRALGVLASEMETAALYLTAMKLRKKALALLTVTDDDRLDKHLPAKERAQTLRAMVTIALETAL